MKHCRIPLFVLILSLVVLISSVGAEDVLYARYPALSPDGQTIAFTYQGDIWAVPAGGGEATRLTVHDGEDIRPSFSPDGNTIAFASYRYGNYDVFTIPSQGGPASRLTYHSSSDIPSGWFPGSDSVLFTSQRDGRRSVYKIAATGGAPIALLSTPWEHLYGARVTSDHSRLLYCSGSGLSRWWRRDLRSSLPADMFVLDRNADSAVSVRLTDHPGHDMWPVMDEEAGVVYFVSCQGDWSQVFSVPLDGGTPTQLTQFTDDGVQWLNSNPQGTMLVFEQGFHVWTLDPSNPTPQRVGITIRTDEQENLIDHLSFTDKVEYFSLSPDDKKIAAVVHGDVFILAADDPKAARAVTRTPARERSVTWGSDSRTVYYASDRNGNYDIFAADASTGEEWQITSDVDDEHKPLVSPDGRYLVFYRGLDEIIRYDLENNTETVWVTGPFLDFAIETTTNYSWSPDSKWLTFSLGGPTFAYDIYLTDLGGTRHNISRIGDWNDRPRFSPDGNFVYFSHSDRWGEATYRVYIKDKPYEFAEATIDSLFLPDEDEDDEDKTDYEDQEIPAIVVDTSNIEHRRARSFTISGNSAFPVVTPDAEKYLFVADILGGEDIWSVNIEDEPDLSRLTKSKKSKRFLTVDSDGDYVFYLESGVIKRTKVDGSETETLSFETRFDINTLVNNRQKFREGWQMLNSYFYDSSFHGTNWDAVREKYQPVVDHIRTDAEFDNLMKEVMGELRASHLHIYERRPGPDATVRSAELGIEYDSDLLEADGMYRIEKVYSLSPAEFVGLKVGQYIRAINGTEVNRETTVASLLAGQIGHRITLSVSDTPEGKGRDVHLQGMSGGGLYTCAYEDWVAHNRQLVDSLSNGRLAYLHIRGMNQSSMDRFNEELVWMAESKSGAVIDVRFNGGGWTAVHILGNLVKSPFILRTFREQPPTSENKMRSRAFERPMICLTNGGSGSNAEIFAEGFKTLGLGKVVGTPTSGAVIGTSSYYLIDGTRIRRPSWGSYATDMEDTDLFPRQPDILIENLPDDWLNIRDPQLERAVEELLKEL